MHAMHGHACEYIAIQTFEASVVTNCIIIHCQTYKNLGYSHIHAASEYYITACMKHSYLLIAIQLSLTAKYSANKTVLLKGIVPRGTFYYSKQTS